VAIILVRLRRERVFEYPTVDRLRESDAASLNASDLVEIRLTSVGRLFEPLLFLMPVVAGLRAEAMMRVSFY
jgi:hypothetical protein